MSSSTHSFARLTIDCLECCRALGRGQVLTQPQPPVICLLTHGSAGSTGQSPHSPLTRSVGRVSTVCVRVEHNGCANRVQQPKATKYQKKQTNDIARCTLAALAVRARHGQSSANGAGGPASAPPHDHCNCAIPASPASPYCFKPHTNSTRTPACAVIGATKASMQHLISDCCPSAITGYALVPTCRSRRRSGPLLHTMALTLSVT